MNKISRRKWISNSVTLGARLVLVPQLSFSLNEPIVKNDFIRLNANENPYGPSQKAIDAIKSNLLESNRYPIAYAKDLINAISKTENLEPNQIMLGAGSTELLQQLGEWIIHNNYHLTYASPSFEIISNYVNKFGGITHKTLLNKYQQHDLETISCISKKHPGAVYIVNPNNPTGTKLDKSDLLSFCKTVSKHSYVIIDEAYIEYIGIKESLKELTLKNPKIIILRTFSKIYGLAGLRIGYLLAHPDTIDLLKPYQIWRSSSVSNLSIQAGLASLKDVQFVKITIEKNKSCLHFTQTELEKLGVPIVKSCTNFLFFNTTAYKGSFAKSMYKEGILIGELTLGSNTWGRVSIGNINEMKRFIEVTKSLWH